MIPFALSKIYHDIGSRQGQSFVLSSLYLEYRKLFMTGTVNLGSVSLDTAALSTEDFRVVLSFHINHLASKISRLVAEFHTIHLVHYNFIFDTSSQLSTYGFRLVVTQFHYITTYDFKLQLHNPYNTSLSTYDTMFFIQLHDTKKNSYIV